MKAPGSRRDVKRLSQVLRKFEGRSTGTASRKTCVIWNCVHHARKHLRGRRPPRDSGGVDANPKVFSRLLIAGLDDTNLSGELHRYTPARTYPSDSEARPAGSDKRCREGTKNRVEANNGLVDSAKYLCGTTTSKKRLSSHREPRCVEVTRAEASTVVKTRQCQSEGSSGHNNRRTHRDQVLR